MLIPAAAASAGAPPGLGVAALPDSAQICSCNNVSKGGICAAVEGGCTTVGALKTWTKAGTTCGGCVPLVTQMLKAEMKKRGVAVNTSCASTSPIRARSCSTWCASARSRPSRTLVAKHGRAWAATSASRRWPPSSRPAGTSSCSRSATPGCRTRTTTSWPTCRRTAPTRWCRACRAARSRPTGLIAVGEVAKKYGLYTKITGGQRIDLFGAQVDQLPLIWRELIAAGFESGHAYGKSLRTVKSCVGSTWCRYGVQDSRRPRHRTGEPLQGPARAAQDQVRASPAAPANAPRRRARTSASSPPRRAGTSTSAATAA